MSIAGGTVGIAMMDSMVEEARSVLATIIAHVINFIRTLAIYVMEYMRKFMTYLAENPLAMTMFVSNIIVWIS